MARPRNLGVIDPIIRSTLEQSDLNDRIKILQAQMGSVLSSSVGALGEFNLQNDILVTNNRSISVSGSDNYLYINGTDRAGNYETYRFDVRGGGLFVEVSGSIGI